jgi:hypothetical protein
MTARLGITYWATTAAESIYVFQMGQILQAFAYLTVTYFISKKTNAHLIGLSQVFFGDRKLKAPKVIGQTFNLSTTIHKARYVISGKTWVMLQRQGIDSWNLLPLLVTKQTCVSSDWHAAAAAVI